MRWEERMPMHEGRQASDRKGLALELHQAARALKDSKGDFEQLRGIERALRTSMIRSTDEDLCFVAFLIPTLVEDFFYNLAGDIPSSEQLFELRKRVISEIAQSLEDLALALDGGSMEAVYRACRALVVAYVRGIEDGQTLPIRSGKNQ